MTPVPQQGWPSPPQARQVGLAPPPPHTKPALQVRVAVAPVPQHAWPMPPQGWHEVPPPPAVHEKPVLQVPAPKPVAGGQQAWPMPPQAVQA